ncbi:unnamed protein product [Linum tenue]|uniref:Uncharacterized protein n=2 Tax=Linum tenue TaxID=586396 RepID=A0AAV0PBU4_9ROSI|nr:unnamed protein product [Linum tenue]
MSSKILNRPYGGGNYAKLDKEDPDEVFHRRAQFLIYKVMQRADDSRRGASFCQIKLCKLKVRIGKRLKKLRKGVVLSMSAARLRIYRMIRIQWKRLFGGRSIAAAGGGGCVVLPAAAAASIFPSL